MKLFYLFICVLPLIGCENFIPKKAPIAPPQRPIDVTRQLTAGQQPPITSQTQSEWGVIRCQANQLNNFNARIKKFLSSSRDPHTMKWHVDCSGSAKYKGGVWIKGQVRFMDGGFSPNNPSQNLVNISEDSYLEIHVVDIAGQPVARLRMSAVPHASEVEGPFITLTFSDNTGKVSLTGTVENGVFFGELSYENFVTWDGQHGSFKGSLGTFSIYPCSLFNCLGAN